MSDPAWIWEVLACPECRQPLPLNGQPDKLCCANPACGYESEYRGRFFNLLPSELDRHQKAENEFRLRLADTYADSVQWMDADTYLRFKLYNRITYYSFTSQYQYFRDVFIRRYTLSGRGLEIGGATGQSSAFIKFFYPSTQMIASDVAPYNIEIGMALAEWLGMQTDYFLLVDAERLPFNPASFDFIFSSGMLHHLGDLPRALQQGHRALKPGGKWYIINELAIGSLPRLYWNSRFGQKGQQARSTGIRENSYTLPQWQNFFTSAGFRIVEMHFHHNPKHKMESWPRAAYYDLIRRLPERLIKMGLPCEVNFVLEKL